MSILKEAAESALERAFPSINYADYSAIFDGLNEIDTLAERDAELEELWSQFSDIPMDPDTECMEAEFLGFPAGTHREDIWHWFDERYSKGVAHLLYGDGVDRTAEIAQLYYLKQICDDCESESCAYHADGICRFSLVHGRKPEWTDHDGCIDYTLKEERR